MEDSEEELGNWATKPVKGALPCWKALKSTPVGTLGANIDGNTVGGEKAAFNPEPMGEA